MRIDRLVLLLAALLAACSPVARAPQAAVAAACRASPDGMPPAAWHGPQRSRQRPRQQIAERGIGGTGIIGVISGFASLCLAGHEVQLPPDAQVSINGIGGHPELLRAGQLAVVTADETPSGLQARQVIVRFELIGPVQRRDGNRLIVAGQTVWRDPATLGIDPQPEQWVAVSGLRRLDDTVVATRIEPAARGRVLVRGTISGDDHGPLRIGGLDIVRSLRTMRLSGLRVAVTGRLSHGLLVASSAAPDPLYGDPDVYFDPSVTHVWLEGYAEIAHGRLRVGPSFSTAAPPVTLAPGRHVLRFSRSDGHLAAIGAEPDGDPHPHPH